MKFNVVFGLAAALALAPNAVALNLFGARQDATPTSGAQPSGTVPSGLPQSSSSGSEGGFGGGFGGGAQESGRPQASGTVPSGVSGGSQPSGSFGQGGHHGHGGQGGFPSGGAQPSGSFGGSGQGGEGGAAPTAAPSGTFGGSSGQESGFITVSGALPTGSATAESGSSSEGNRQFERVHARQIRPF
ncbi:hypothetical protein PEBR_09498 [Penicillium brasilianum]|uniref:Uncharacterized protein n=1 Tax=Penicillium brasilianum TaxID=104259 RepID=A0A1S9S1W3_PENBI|nr:hypothetical protein PEBR_09498 [Penicillium brasilianum]